MEKLAGDGCLGAFFDRDLVIQPPHGRVDYLLFVDRRPVGTIEAKPAGTTLTGAEEQSSRYAAGLPDTSTTL